MSVLARLLARHAYRCSLRGALGAKASFLALAPAVDQGAEACLPEGRIAHGPFEIEASLRPATTRYAPCQA
jgi:hypothetical protein